MATEALARPSLRPPWTSTRTMLALVAVASAAATVWSWNHLDMTVTTLVEGLGDVRNLLDRMLPPRFVDLARVLDLALETFFMAYVGTTVASLLSLPLAFLAARNTSPHPLVGKAARAVIAVCRAIPDVVFALVFVRAVGIGPLPGVLALSLHSVGMVGKLYADAVEQIDEHAREATLSTGASPLQALATAVVPQVLPSFVGTSLYRLDVNLRTSVVLGLVEAGGIGFELQTALRQLVYDRGLGMVVVIAAMVIVVEFASAAIRRSIIGVDAASAVGGDRRSSRLAGDRGRRRSPVSGGGDAEAAGPAEPARLTPPWTAQRILRTAALALGLGLAGLAFLVVDLSPVELVTSLPDVWSTVTQMFPPDFTTARQSMVEGMTETLAIGVVATALGVGLTVPIGLLAARNLAPNRFVYTAARTLSVLIRSVPELVLAIIFVSAIGLGPVPGVFALAVGTVGVLAKLVADSIEEIDPLPRQAVLSTGASRVQEAATSVLPQATPALVGNVLYMLDVNIRWSAIVGIVGGGGIATLLNSSVRTLQLQTTSAIIISLFVVVYALELLAGAIRRRIL